MDFGLTGTYDAGQTVEVKYYTDVLCSTPATSGATQLTDGAITDPTGTSFSITESIQAIGESDIPRNDLTNGRFQYDFCIRVSLFDNSDPSILIDILEVNVDVIVDETDTIDALDNAVTGTVNDAGTGGTDDIAFQASAYLCDPLVDEATPLTGADLDIAEGSSFSICFKSDDFGSGTVGIIDLTALQLSGNFTDGGSLTQDFIGESATSLLFTANTCEDFTAGVTTPNGNGNPLTTGVQYCHVTIPQIPTFFFLNTADNGDAEDIVVQGTASVTLLVADRRLNARLLLGSGDSGPVEADIAPFTAVAKADEEEDEEDVSFWSWLFSCFGLF